jgi:hypothetical protein
MPMSFCMSIAAPKSCHDIWNGDPTKEDGVYNISVGGQPKEVFCDMSTQPGGWTVRSYATLHDMI